MITVDQGATRALPREATITGHQHRRQPADFVWAPCPVRSQTRGLCSIQVDVLSNTQFETEEDQMVSGLSAYQKPGDTVFGFRSYCLTTDDH